MTLARFTAGGPADTIFRRQHDIVAQGEPWQHGPLLESHADAHRLGADFAS